MTHGYRRNMPAPHFRSLSDMLSDGVRQAAALVRKEGGLARTEISENASRGGRRIVLARPRHSSDTPVACWRRRAFHIRLIFTAVRGLFWMVWKITQ